MKELSEIYKLENEIARLKQELRISEERHVMAVRLYNSLSDERASICKELYLHGLWLDSSLRIVKLTSYEVTGI